jgi:hypothetical protein
MYLFFRSLTAVTPSDLLFTNHVLTLALGPVALSFASEVTVSIAESATSIELEITVVESLAGSLTVADRTMLFASTGTGGFSTSAAASVSCCVFS